MYILRVLLTYILISFSLKTYSQYGKQPVHKTYIKKSLGSGSTLGFESHEIAQMVYDKYDKIYDKINDIGFNDISFKRFSL